MKQCIIRILSILAVVTVSITLAACSTGQTPEPSTPATPTPQASSEGSGTTADPDNPWAGLDLSKRETINCYVVGTLGTDWERITQMAIKKIEDKINTTVNFVHVPWSDFQAKYTLFLAADADVDIIYAAPWVSYAEYVQSGAFKGFDMDFVKKYMPLIYEKQAKASWDEVTFDGKLYGVPQNWSYVGAGGVITTQDILDKYNFRAEDIKNRDDLKRFILTIAADKNNTGMYAINPQNSYPMDSNYIGYHTFTMDDGNVTWMLYPYEKAKLNGTFNIDNLQWFATSDIYKNFCLEMAEFNKAGVFPANVMSASTMINQNFAEGKSAINFATPEDANAVRTEMKAKGKEVVYLNCTFDEGSATMKGGYLGYAACFPVNSKKTERAATALDCMKFDPEINRLLVGGIEGEHYILDKESNKRLLGPRSAAYPWNGWFNYLLISQDDPELKIDDDLQAIRNRHLAAEVSRDNFPIIGFTYNNSKYQAEIAVLSSMFNEYRFSFGFGIFQDKTEEKLEEFIRRCKDAGIDNVIADYKQQLKEFLDSKK
jgi:putative aldouronate transport system substrate-binding protein